MNEAKSTYFCKGKGAGLLICPIVILRKLIALHCSRLTAPFRPCTDFECQTNRIQIRNVTIMAASHSLERDMESLSCVLVL